MPQEVIDSTDPLAGLIHHDPRQRRIIHGTHRPDPGNSHAPHVTPTSRLILIHPDSVLVINEDEACPTRDPSQSGSAKNQASVRSIGLADHRADRKNWLLSTLGVQATDPARYTREPVTPATPTTWTTPVVCCTS